MISEVMHVNVLGSTRHRKVSTELVGGPLSTSIL